MTPDSPEPKPWYISKGIIGALVAAICALAGIAGWHLDANQWTQILLDAAVLVGAGIALWGRIAANRPIRVRRAIPVKKDRPRSTKGNPAK